MARIVDRVSDRLRRTRARVRWSAASAVKLAVAAAAFLVGAWPQPSSAQATGWVTENPLPCAAHLTGVWASPKGEVFAVGGGGTIVRFDGRAWRLMESGTEMDLGGVWGTSEKDVFATTLRGAILHFDGSRWRESCPGAFERALHGIWGSSERDVYAVGYDGAMYHRDGKGWSLISDDAFYRSWPRRALARTVRSLLFGGAPVWTLRPHLIDVWGSSSMDVFVVGGSGLVLHFDGQRWSPMTTGTQVQLYSVWGSSARDVFAGGADGTILHYDGKAWSPMASGTKETIFDLWGGSSRDVYAIGGSAFLRYDGARWTSLPAGAVVDVPAAPGKASERARTPVLRYVSALAGRSPTDIVAVGMNGLIAHWDGALWRQVNSNLAPEGLRALFAFPPHEALGVGVGGVILRHDGTRWTTMASGTSVSLEGVWADAQGGAVAVGQAGTILRWNGRDWRPMQSPVRSDLKAVWGTSARDIMAVGDDGAVVRYDGWAWRAMESGTRRSLRAVWCRSSSDVFAAGNDGTLLHFDGREWRPMSIPEGSRGQSFKSVWGTRDQLFVAGGDVLRYDGRTWAVEPIKGARVWGRGRDDVYVAAHQGNVYHFDGRRWQNQRAGFGDFAALSGSGEDVFATDFWGTILHRRDPAAGP